MKKLYFDCSNGISGDMALGALIKLGACQDVVDQVINVLDLKPDDGNGDSHRAYHEVKKIILTSTLARKVKSIALLIYEAIAKGEAQVHETDIDQVHFHEVGRDRAIANIVGVAAALEDLHIEEIYCSKIHDGTGHIDCSHGRIPVPVPAVMAMRSDCDDYRFVSEDVPTEMVTPSGLGILMGIGAKYAKEMPPGQIVCETEVKGKRDTGRGGLKVYLIQSQEEEQA